MLEAVVTTASSAASGHPAEHAVSPLEANFAWQANEASAQHTLAVDLGSAIECDGFSFVHHETDDVTASLDITAERSRNGTDWTPVDLAFNSDGTDVPDDLSDDTHAIKLRYFIDGENDPISVTSRYWRFTVKGTDSPSYYAPSDARVSMCWLFRLHEFDRGRATPTGDLTNYPGSELKTLGGRRFRTGWSVNPITEMAATFMFNAAEFNVMLDFVCACNAARTPFTLVDVDGVRRLCVFGSDQVEETLVNTDIHEVTVKFVELPLIGKDGYH
jgi:hypothetical protein